MKKIFFFLFMVSILAFSCDMLSEPKYIRMSDKIVSRHLNKMKQQYSLKCIGNGGGFMHSVNQIILSYNLNGPKSIEEIRTLLVITTEDLLKAYNEDEKIRPFLKNFPFTVSNISVDIVLVDQNGISLKNEGLNKDIIWGGFQLSGKVFYSIINEEKPSTQKIHSETYEEALKIVKNQNPELFL
jgi:hypothetical protein